jgi:hypothetical protein
MECVLVLVGIISHVTVRDTNFKMQHEDTVQSYVLAVWDRVHIVPFATCVTSILVNISICPANQWPHSYTPRGVISLSPFSSVLRLSCEIWSVGQASLNWQLLCQLIILLQDPFSAFISS